MRAVWATISKKEWQLVAAIAAAVMVLSTLPLIYGWLITPPGHVFTAVHFAAPNDWFVYYSYIEQARDNHWLFRDLFTLDPHQPVLNIFWLAVGLFAKITHTSALVAFELARLLLVAVFYFVVYLFLATVLAERRQRQVALLLISFGSGLGLLLLNRLIAFPFNFANGQFNWPLDLWVPESITFLTLYYSPHFIASLTLIIFIFLQCLWFEKTKRFWYALAAGIAAGILFEFHPFHILTIFGVLFMYAAAISIRQRHLNWPLILFFAVVVVLSLPSIGYYLYLLQFDPVMAQKALQNLTWMPPLWITAFSYGLLLVFGASGVAKIIKQKPLSNQMLFVLVWLATQAALLYAPVSYQRRMSEGWHIPLALVAGLGLWALWQKIKQRQTVWQRRLYQWRYTWILLLSLALGISNLFQIATDVFIYADHREMSYLTADYVAAASWLRQSGQSAAVFNTANNVVNELPAYCDCSVYVGHGVETPFFASRQQEVDWFFKQNRAETIERTFLYNRHISYIFYGPDERKLGGYAPDQKPYLRKVFTNATIGIYQVLPEPSL